MTCVLKDHWAYILPSHSSENRRIRQGETGRNII